jgi:hypothetical protein
MTLLTSQNRVRPAHRRSPRLFTAPAPPVHSGRLRRRAQFELKRFAARFAPESPWKLRYAGAIRDFDRFALQLADSSGIIRGRFTRSVSPSA